MSQNSSIHLLSRLVVTRLLITLFATAFFLGAIVTAIVLFDRGHAREITTERGRNTLNLEHEFLVREIQSIQSDLLFLANETTLREFRAGDASNRAEVERDYVQFAMRKTTYDQIRFLDKNGVEVIRVNFNGGQPVIATEQQLQSKSDRYYFKQAQKLKRDEILVSQFDLNVEHGQIERPLKPVIRFVTPVFGEGDKHCGFLVLNYLGGQLLSRLADVSRGSPGRVLLLNHEGEYLYVDESADRWGWILGHNRSFRSHDPVAWKEIRTGESGQTLVNNRLLIYERVHLSTCDESMNTHQKDKASSHDADSIENSLILAWEIRNEDTYAASSNLLQNLLLMYCATLTIVGMLSWYLGYVRAIRSDQQNQIEQSEERLRTLSQQLLMAQEDERRNISRQLHDELGQQVTAISLDLKSAAQQQDPAKAMSRLDCAIKEAEKLLQGIHAIAADVRPSVLDDLGFDDAIESFVSSFTQRTGIDVDCDIAADWNGMAPRVSDNVYRILQEALTNVAKHANTKQVRVQMRNADGRLRLTVADRGAGFETNNQDTSRLGILGMRERAELLGGEFHLFTSPGKGTSVEVNVPLRTDS